MKPHNIKACITALAKNTSIRPVFKIQNCFPYTKHFFLESFCFFNQFVCNFTLKWYFMSTIMSPEAFLSPKKGFSHRVLNVHVWKLIWYLILTQSFTKHSLSNYCFSKVRSTEFTSQSGWKLPKLPGNYRPSKTVASVNAIGLKHVEIEIQVTKSITCA